MAKVIKQPKWVDLDDEAIKKTRKGGSSSRVTKTHVRIARISTPCSRNESGSLSSLTDSSEEEVDVEVVRSRRYWEKWSAGVSCELLRQVHEDLEAPLQKQALFSGRIGKEPRMKLSASIESLATDISLLSTSSLDMKEVVKMKKKLGKKAQALEKAKPDWVKLARERKGTMLDRMMRRDAGMMEGMTRTQHGQNGYMNRPNALEIMTDQERTLITKCAYKKGLSGKNKSCSTENVLTFVPKVRKPRSRLSTASTSASRNTRTCHSSASTRSKLTTNRSHTTQGRLKVVRNHGRTPSPGLIVQQAQGKQRSTSANVLMSCENLNMSRVSTPKSSRPSARWLCTPFSQDADHHSGAPDSVYNYQSGQAGEYESTYTRRVKQRLHSTIQALQRCTGLGDNRCDLKVIEEERGRYTDGDYAKNACYPQNVRIAPPLSKVIRDDIVKRMGRPREQSLRIQDIKILDADNPVVGRTNRNLLIFNWLNSIKENDFEKMDAPSIYNLEGEGPTIHVYPTVYAELVEGVSLSSLHMQSDSSGRSMQSDLEDDLAALNDDWMSDLYDQDGLGGSVYGSASVETGQLL